MAGNITAKSTVSPAPAAPVSAFCLPRMPRETDVKVVQRIPVKIVLDPGSNNDHQLAAR